MAAFIKWKLIGLIAGLAIGATALWVRGERTQNFGQEREAAKPRTKLSEVKTFPRASDLEQEREESKPRARLPTVRTFPRSSQPRKPINGIASVIDGDTIEIHDQRIRLWGIDAPEGNQFCYIQGKPWRCGQQAAHILSNRIGRRTVSCRQRDRDQYGRVVAVCSIRHTPDLGGWLVREGWALDFPRYSDRAYAANQGQAKAARRGVWRGNFDKPWEWRQRR